MYSRNDSSLNFFVNQAAALKESLENSAFRRGVSTGIQGIMKAAPSDHSPISVNFNDIPMVSWNLLSDEHTKNFLYDVARKEYFAKHPIRADGQKINWRFTFENFGEFILANSYKDEAGIYQINITEELLQAFVKNNHLKAQQLEHSTDSLSVADKKPQSQITSAYNIAKDAEEFVSLLLDTTHSHHDDFKNSIAHIIEIIYSIKYGYLQWENRLNKIKENKQLIKGLISHDIFCLQECTNPEDLLHLLQNATKQSADKNFSLISHKVKEQTKDHCAIIYDENKYMLIDVCYFGLAFNTRNQQHTKPCILAKLCSLDSGNEFIVGSIHHPGTGISELSEIMEKADSLAEKEQKTPPPIIVLGDYNHQKKYFEDDIKGTDYAMVMPSIGTMAGFEYGNNNSAIDGVLTNRPSKVVVNLLQLNAFAEQVRLPIQINFLFDQNIQEINYDR